MNDIQINPSLILCDFDGTISLKDVTDTLLEDFGREGYEALEEAWEKGRIGSRECMDGQIRLLDATHAQIDDCLKTIHIDPDFKRFVEKAQEHHIPVQVVSDGLDYAIHSILKQNGLGHLPIFANHLQHIGEKSWQLTFPYTMTACEKGSGNCKCHHVAQQRQDFSHILYVGDGASDFCVSNKVDIVFAKNRLIDYCEQRQISFYPIRHFADALALWHKVFSTREVEQNSYQNVLSV